MTLVLYFLYLEKQTIGVETKDDLEIDHSEEQQLL